MQTTQFHDFEDSTVIRTIAAEGLPPRRPRRFVLGLFWRTFFLLSALILLSMLAWLRTLQAMESEARDLEAGRNLASIVNLSRAALMHLDGIARVTLVKAMSEDEGLHISPRRTHDQYLVMTSDDESFLIAQELHRLLGPQTLVASKVNGRPGLWIGFQVQGDPFWMLAEHQEWAIEYRSTWMVWLLLATLLSLAGAALIARLISQPLKALSFAASRVREGRFEASRLDESVPTHEIRDVNIGFNRMAQRLSQAERDRALMLAGISHDLRTPLARLRLEAEMSVPDEQARAHMVADIEQLDAIVDKFLDYARPQQAPLGPVDLNTVVQSSTYPFGLRDDVNIRVQISPGLRVLGDEVELGRVLSNLIENTCRYGRTPETGVADVELTALAHGDWALIRLRDHGRGVSAEQLNDLLKPFYRGESARTAANGAGLGLAIVDRTIRRMGGEFGLALAAGGGLAANIRLPLAR